MLGIASGLIQPRYSHRIKHTYTSDFTSDNDGWNPVGIEGTLNQAFDQDIPGGSGGGWMKCKYDTTQTNISSLSKSGSMMPAGGNQRVGDFAVMSFKIYLDGDWGGPDPVTGLVTNLTTAAIKSHEIPQDQIVEVVHIADSTIVGFYSDIAQIRFDESGDLPQEDATFWLKDIKIDTYGYPL